jgi:hypothetical protein
MVMRLHNGLESAWLLCAHKQEVKEEEASLRVNNFIGETECTGCGFNLSIYLSIYLSVIKGNLVTIN